MPDIDADRTETFVNDRESGEPRLVASRCTLCSDIAFPAQDSCPRCGAQQSVRHLLGPHGVLWTWTVQTFPPKPPFQAADPFEPYGVGYVEFPGEVRVQARLTESDPTVLRIGAPMQLVITELPGQPGTDVYAFAPVGQK
jgi:uncharacterized OB-fold protein